MLIVMRHLYSDKDKKLITDKMWGIYYKPDIEGLGVQGGTSPYKVEKHFDEVNVDPYGLESKNIKQQMILLICGVQL